jgi:hypothetical protein
MAKYLLGKIISPAKNTPYPVPYLDFDPVGYSGARSPINHLCHYPCIMLCRSPSKNQKAIDKNLIVVYFISI